MQPKPHPNQSHIKFYITLLPSSLTVHTDDDDDDTESSPISARITRKKCPTNAVSERITQTEFWTYAHSTIHPSSHRQMHLSTKSLSISFRCLTLSSSPPPAYRTRRIPMQVSTYGKIDLFSTYAETFFR